LPAKSAAGLSAVAALVALSSGCSKPQASPNDDSKLAKHVVGEPVDVQTINSRATYLLLFPHLKDGVYTVKLEINCVECTRWMPGRLVLVKKDGTRLRPTSSTIDFSRHLVPFEIRRGEVTFDIKDPHDIDRIVLMRGEPLVATAKWTVDSDGPIPTVEPKEPVQIVAYGDSCKKAETAAAETADGDEAYCSRLDYTDTYLWSPSRGVIPNEPVEVVQKEAAPAAKPKPEPKKAPPPPPAPFGIQLPPWLK
jgi:hypothetical protein